MHKIILITLLAFTSINIKTQSNAQTTTNNTNTKCNPKQLQVIQNYFHQQLPNKWQANFSQIDHHGKKNNGTFFLHKPHYIKIAYQNPKIDVIFDKGKVTYHDHRLNSIKQQNINSGIFEAILSNNLNSKSIECLAIYQQQQEQKQTLIAHFKTNAHTLQQQNIFLKFNQFSNKISLKQIEVKTNHQAIQLNFEQIT